MLKVIISLALIFSFGGSLLAGTQSCGGGRGCSMSGMQMMECCRTAQDQQGDRESVGTSPCCVVNREQPMQLRPIVARTPAPDLLPAHPVAAHLSAAGPRPLEYAYLKIAYSPSMQRAYLEHLSLLI